VHTPLSLLACTGRQFSIFVELLSMAGLTSTVVPVPEPALIKGMEIERKILLFPDPLSDELLLGTCHWELGAAGLQDEMPT
jgi:hypothetical protein